jgi:GNAT superfamily N-acetyltransferase
MEVRFAQSRDDARLIFALLVGLHGEVATVPMNPGKAFERVVDVVTGEDGVAWMAIEDERVIASVGLEMVPYWYADASFLADQWFYVHPDHRDGAAARLLLEEVGRFADETGLEAVIASNNPRRGRSPRTPFEKIASTVRFTPAGSVMRIASDA